MRVIYSVSVFSLSVLGSLPVWATSGQMTADHAGQAIAGNVTRMTTFLTPAIVLIGMVIMAGILWGGMRQLTASQKEHMRRVKREEKSLQQREKLLLASAFSSELTENKIKCETFISIYTELLRNLRDMDRRASYEDTGDFIHQHPPLSRQTYDKNLEKLSYFSPKLASDLNQAYSAIRTEPQYFTLDTAMPRAAAIRIVEMVIDDAQKTLEPLEALIAALDMIIRDSTKTREMPSLMTDEDSIDL